jgi:hypothetical protein
MDFPASKSIRPAPYKNRYIGNFMYKRFQGPFRDGLMFVCLRYERGKWGREEGKVRYEFITYRSWVGGWSGMLWIHNVPLPHHCRTNQKSTAICKVHKIGLRSIKSVGMCPVPWYSEARTHTNLIMSLNEPAPLWKWATQRQSNLYCSLILSDQWVSVCPVLLLYTVQRWKLYILNCRKLNTLSFSDHWT